MSDTKGVLGFPEGYFDNEESDGDGTLEYLNEKKQTGVEEQIIEMLLKRDKVEHFNTTTEAALTKSDTRNPDAYASEYILLTDDYNERHKKEYDANAAYYSKNDRNPGGNCYITAALGPNDREYILLDDNAIGMGGTTENQIGRARAVGQSPGFAQPQNNDSLQPKETSILTQEVPPMMPEYTGWTKPVTGVDDYWGDDKTETTEGQLHDPEKILPHEMISPDKSKRPPTPRSKFAPTITPKRSGR